MRTRDTFAPTLLARRVSPLPAKLAALLIATMPLFSGCGGGGGGTSTPVVITPTPTPVASASVDPTPTPIPTPTPVVTPGPTPTPVPTPPALSAKEQSVSANFEPNYVPADAEEYLHWKDNKNIRVFVRPAVSDVKSLTPSSTIDAGRARSIAEQAANLWTTATGGDFRFVFVSSEADADVKVVFVDQLVRVDGSIAGGVGLTDYSYTFPDSSDTKRANLQSATAQVKAAQADDALLDTTAHELGHALGIEKHSPNDADLLYATSLPPSIVTNRDQNTVFFLYYSQAATGGRSVRKNSTPSPVYTGETVCDPAHR